MPWRLGLLWGLSLCLAAPAGAASMGKERLQLGDEAPPFTIKAVNAEVINNSFVSSTRFMGADAQEPKKAVLISFFATYCEPCKKEIPFLAALFDTYKDKGLGVLLVSIDKEADKVELIKELAQTHAVTFPVLSDRFNIVAKRYFVSKLPCVYLMGGDAKVLMANVGYGGEQTPRLILEEVRKALSEPADEAVAQRLLPFVGGAPDQAAAVAQEAVPAPAPMMEPAAGQAAPPAETSMPVSIPASQTLPVEPPGAGSAAPPPASGTGAGSSEALPQVAPTQEEGAPATRKKKAAAHHKPGRGKKKHSAGGR